MEFLLNPVNIGIDIGKIDDPSAISVAEVVRIPTGRSRYRKDQDIGRVDEKGVWIPPKGIDPIMKTRYIVRFIGRLPLGMSYPKQAEKIVDLFCGEQLEGRKIRVFVDTTGVGQAIYDDIAKELDERKTSGTIKPGQSAYELSIQPTSFVRGETWNRTRGTLGKKYLVGRMQSLLQNESVDLPDTPEAAATCEELRVYEVKISEDGKDTYEAKTGAHDDLVTCLALSCLEDPYKYAVTYSERVY